MRRRSFFGMLFGGLLARWLPRQRPKVDPLSDYQPYQPLPPGLAGKYRFGFTGFKPAEEHARSTMWRYGAKPESTYGFFPEE